MRAHPHTCVREVFIEGGGERESTSTQTIVGAVYSRVHLSLMATTWGLGSQHNCATTVAACCESCESGRGRLVQELQVVTDESYSMNTDYVTVVGFVRVLNVSGGDAPARIDVNNIEAEKDFRGIMTYTHSKSVLEAMSVALAQDMKPTNVSVRASEHRDDEELDIRTSAGTDEAHTSFFQVFLPRRRREICEAGGALYSVGLQERCRFRCCDWSYYRGRYLQVL